MHKKKQGYKGKPSKGGAGEEKNLEYQDMRKLLSETKKEVQKFGLSHMAWKEQKMIENKSVMALGGKPLKKHRLPLSVARPMMKKQKERERKMQEERVMLGQYGGQHVGSNKRTMGKHKQKEGMTLKSSEGHFRGGVLNVKHLLNSAPAEDKGAGSHAFSGGRRKGSRKKQGKKRP